MVSKSNKVSQFLKDIKVNLKLNPDESLMLYINKTLAKNETVLQELYEKQADQDGFLYFSYCEMASLG